MTTALTQVVGSLPPELPGTTVLRYDAAGQPGAVLHDLGSERGTLHCRLMVNASAAEGGGLVIAGGIDGDGTSCWQLRLDAGDQTLRLTAGNAQCNAVLPAAFAWHGVEVGIDAGTGSITLRVNGIEHDADSGSINPTRYAWLGGAFPDGALTGVIDVESWVLSTSAIGLPVATPRHDHAGDPGRWLVVYNRSNPDSAAWAQTYRARRGVPYANLCGLSLPSSETITDTAYQSMRQQITDYLADNHLLGQVVGVLLGFGVPGYVELLGLATAKPVTALLHTDDTHTLAVVNPLYQDPVATRPAPASYTGIRLTGRIDAADLAGAVELIDRADAVMAAPLSHDHAAELFIDISPDDPATDPVLEARVAEWAGGMSLSRLRLPTTVFDAIAPAQVSNDAVVWGWRDAAPPPGFYASPAGRRAACLQLAPDAQSANTARTPAATDWLSTALSAGYAAAAAPSLLYSLSGMPLPHVFFEALRQGWTLAEAWLVAQPFAREGVQVVGDPLITIGFPKAGYDVFGPVDRLDRVHEDQPLAVLHDGERELQLGATGLPEAGVPARYLVRRLDAEGRPDHASANAYVSVDAGQVVRPALPAWPVDTGWRAMERDNLVQLTAVWPAPIRPLGIDRVDLQAQSGAEDPLVIAQTYPTTGLCRITFLMPRPDTATRYRFRVVQGDALFYTPWSAAVDGVSLPDATLTLLETPS